MNLYQQLLKPYFFQLDPEKAHHLTMRLFKFGLHTPLLGNILKKQYIDPSSRHQVQHMGLTFNNPLGLAAGFDKDGKYIDLLKHLGFGFIEIGTVTPRPQGGNPKPRLFRLPHDEALINRMGFNNDGVDAMVKRILQSNKGNMILGGNIGKNKDTDNQDAWKDYLHCFQKLQGKVDYFVINVSSPNTPGLRALQNKESLTKIISEIQNQNHSKTPVLLKIAPDMHFDQLTEIIEVIVATGLQGIVTNNTTVDRSQLTTAQDKLESIGPGGLSGKPLFTASNQILQQVKKQLPATKTIIASGGVHDISAVQEKRKLGADLVQIYTGMIYQGPSFIKEALQNL